MQIIYSDSEDQPGYKKACTSGVFNLRRPRHRPSAVIQVTCTKDIVEAIQIAHQQKCQIAVRSGGHSMAVWSLHEKSILLDLGSWKELKIDPETMIAQVTPSATSKELNDALIEHELIFPGGHCPDVGLGGYMLQGGMGWNARNWGWACERLDAVEVITARGEVLFCNAQKNQDLYWAARGAGPTFPGIVTKFYLQLMPAPTEGPQSSGYIYPCSLYHTVFDWVLSLIPRTDHNTEVVMVGHYPENSTSHDDLCFLVNFVSMEQTISEAKRVLQQVHSTRPCGTIAEWVCQEDSLDNLYSHQQKANPESHYYYTDNAFLENHADIIATLQEAFLTIPLGKSFAFWYPMHPHSRRSLSDMAFSVQSDHYFCMYSICESADDAPRYKAWVKEAMAKVRLHSMGAYIGESDGTMPASWYWGDHNASRLVKIGRKWDSEKIFAGVHEPAEHK